MSRPPIYNETTRTDLLAATAEAVASGGPDRVSLREVARAAGTSTSAVYALFGGKDELLGAVIVEGFASFGASQLEAEPGGLSSLGRAYRAWAQEHPSLYRLMFDGSLASYDRKSSREALDPLIRSLAARGAPDPIASALSVWAHVHGAVSLELACMAPRGVDVDAVYATVLDSIERMWPVAS